MEDLFFRNPDFFSWIASFSMLILRYVIFAGIPFALFYFFKRNDWFYLKIQQKWPKTKHVHSEIKYSLLTFVIFATIKLGLAFMIVKGWTSAYLDINQYPLWYLPISFVVMLVIHDTWFYWAHRTMHHPKLYRYTHVVHHKSTNPTPWASFSFQPVEAVLEFIWVIPVVMFLPLHVSVIFAFFLWMIAFNVMGHLGYELFPKNFLKTPIGKLFNSSTHHNMHHKFFKGNYGLYFNIWDRIMGTNFPNYEEYYEQVKERQEKQKELGLEPGVR